MYPYLVYSARLFQVLAMTQEYAEALMNDSRVLPLLLQVVREQSTNTWCVESDAEGRWRTLDALASIVRFGLWPSEDEQCMVFLRERLPLLLEDRHLGISY